MDTAETYVIVFFMLLVPDFSKGIVFRLDEVFDCGISSRVFLETSVSEAII